MSNLEVLALREFRRFACAYIYTENIHKLILNINNDCQTNDATFSQLPQPTIRFTSCIIDKNNPSAYTYALHSILIKSFVDFFRNEDIVKLIRNKVYNNVTCDAEKEFINIALNEIQSGNPRYLGLLFNLTILKDNNVYVYL